MGLGADAGTTAVSSGADGLPAEIEVESAAAAMPEVSPEETNPSSPEEMPAPEESVIWELDAGGPRARFDRGALAGSEAEGGHDSDQLATGGGAAPAGGSEAVAELRSVPAEELPGPLTVTACSLPSADTPGASAGSRGATAAPASSDGSTGASATIASVAAEASSAAGDSTMTGSALGAAAASITASAAASTRASGTLGGGGGGGGGATTTTGATGTAGAIGTATGTICTGAATGAGATVRGASGATVLGASGAIVSDGAPAEIIFSCGAIIAAPEELSTPVDAGSAATGASPSVSGATCALPTWAGLSIVSTSPDPVVVSTTGAPSLGSFGVLPAFGWAS